MSEREEEEPPPTSRNPHVHLFIAASLLFLLLVVAGWAMARKYPTQPTKPSGPPMWDEPCEPHGVREVHSCLITEDITDQMQ